jgi:uncharacterized membrane protein
MSGLTNLGITHTAISLVALATGIWTLARDKQISLNAPLGLTYLVTTLLTAVTGLFIFQHGGFGPPHALSLLTLLAIAVGVVLELKPVLGRLSGYLKTVSYTTTFLFHMVPGVTESLTRLPISQPILSSADAPEFKPLYGVLFAAYFIGLAWQIHWLRTHKQLP